MARLPTAGSLVFFLYLMKFDVEFVNIKPL